MGYNQANKVTSVDSDNSGGPSVDFMYGADGGIAIKHVNFINVSSGEPVTLRWVLETVADILGGLADAFRAGQ